MTEAPSPRIPSRPLRDGLPPASLLGFVVDGGRGSTSDRGVVERLRRARAAGVTTFDTVGADPAARAWSQLQDAFPEPDRDLVVLVGRRADPEDRTAGAALRSEPPVGTDSPIDAEALRHVGWTVLTEVDRAGIAHEPANASRSDARPDGPGARAQVLRLSPTGVELESATDRWLCSSPLSLLDQRILAPARRAASEGLLRLFVRDPFAQGRLDGSRLGESWIHRGPSAGPTSLRSLEQEFEPVRRLGFLTEGRKRTLAQASIQFAGHWPWVASVLAPLPTADRMEEMLAAYARPPLTEAELDRIERSPRYDRSGPLSPTLGGSNTATR